MNTNIKKLNIIDYLIIILVACMLSFVFYTFVKNTGVFSKQVSDIEYTVTISEMKEAFVSNIKTGDIVYDNATAFPLGTVVSVATLDNIRGKNVVKIRISARAETHNGILWVNGTAIHSGEYINARVPGLAFSGYCSEIEIN